MNHLDGIHKCGKSFLDAFRIAMVERFDEFFKSLQILDIVLSFTESFCNFEFNASPLRSCKIDLVSWP